MNPVEPQASYQRLLEENQRLRGEVQQLREQQQPAKGISLDLGENRFHVRDVATPEVSIDTLDVRVPQMSKMAGDLLRVASLVNPDKSVQMPSLKGFEKTPMEIEKAHLRVPESTLNEAVQDMKTPGVSGLHVELGEEGRLKLSGTKDGILPLPFEIQGRVSRESDDQVRFSLEKTKVLGFLPVPRLVTDLFASLAAHTLSQAHVEQKGGDFLVNAGAFVPPNVELGLKGITTHDGYLVIDAGPKS